MPSASPLRRSISQVQGSPVGLPRFSARPSAPQNPERRKNPTSQSSMSRRRGRRAVRRPRYPTPALVSRGVVQLAPEPAEKTLPILDRWADLIRRLGTGA